MQFRFKANANGRMTHFDPPWFELTGMTEDLAYGSPERWVSVIHPDDVDRVRGIWEARSFQLDVYEIAYRVRGRTGGYLEFRSKAEPEYDGDMLIGWSGTGELHAPAEPLP